MWAVEMDLDLDRIPVIEAGTMKTRTEQYGRDGTAGELRMGWFDDFGETGVVTGGKADHDVISQIANDGFVGVCSRNRGFVCWAYARGEGHENDPGN